MKEGEYTDRDGRSLAVGDAVVVAAGNTRGVVLRGWILGFVRVHTALGVWMVQSSRVSLRSPTVP
jgi:hypothetical protein